MELGSDSDKDEKLDDANTDNDVSSDEEDGKPHAVPVWRCYIGVDLMDCIVSLT